RVAFSDRVPHLPRSGAPAVRRGSVAPPTDAYRRRRGVLPDRPRRPPDPRGLARAPPRGRRGRLRRGADRDRAVPAERRRRWRASPGRPRRWASARSRALTGPGRDGGRRTEPGRTWSRPPTKCRALTAAGRDGGRRTEPGRTWSRPPTKCRALTALATMTPPPSVHGDLAAPTVIAASIARWRRRVLADLVALAN